jgi:cell wall-associated NlpC family hydrolase
VTRCGGCLKVRRALINKTPKRIAAPLARLLLPTVTTPQAVVNEARSWLGVPFRHQGRDRNGIDCVGLPIVVLQTLGALPADFKEPTNYPPFPHLDQLKPLIHKYCTPLPDEPRPGALITLAWHQTLAHVAIYTEANTLIHAYGRAPHLAVIEHGFRGLWRTRYTSRVWALPGVSYEPA